MLRGSLVYTTDTGKSYKYQVSGSDNSSTLELVIGSNAYDAICFMDNENAEESDDALWERRVSVGLVKTAVETAIHKVDGHKKKSPVNSDLFCRLGALVRYVKTHCSASNEADSLGISLASGEIELDVKSSYNIPFPVEKDKQLATIELVYGNILNLHVKTKYIELTLEEDYELQDLMRKIKDGWQGGFAFTEDYLGFKLPVQNISSTSSVRGMYTNLDDIIRNNPDKEFTYLLNKKYIMVTDDTLDEICKYIYEYDDYVYYDTETSGLNINFYSRTGKADQLVGVVLSVKAGESFFFPTQMKTVTNLCGGDHFFFMEHYMRPILEGKQLVAFNMSFDWKVAYIYDINANIVHDVMALIKLTIGTEYKNYPMGLKENTKLILKRDALSLSDLVVDSSWGDSGIKFWDLDPKLVTLYACPDTDNLRDLMQYCIKADLLGKYNAKKIYEIEIAYALAVGYQEFYGHRIDIDKIDVIRKEIAGIQDECMDAMVKIVGYEFNPNSSPALLRIMYTELGIPEQISRKTGRPTTDKDTLKHLASLTNVDGEPMYPFCIWLKKFREAEGVRKIIDKQLPEHMTSDGYVFSDVQQYGTRTGRVAIKNPNYQSYNDPVKKNVVPRPGYYMFDTDYSSVEYRVLANMVGNKAIMHSFEDPDFDYHAYQAARMYNVPYESVSDQLRRVAKSVNFGLPYGMGDESLGVNIFGEASPENTIKARNLKNAYFKGQEDIRDWFESNRDKGVHEGFTETYFGRRRYYHREDYSIGAIRRQAGNQIIQGCISGDVRIQTEEYGIVKIKNVVGETLNVWDGETWSAGDIMYSGKKRKCIVHFSGGLDIICSPEHKFLVKSAKGNVRFVDCKDLHASDTYKNAHRVVVNQKYAPSVHVYSSEFAYKYVSDTANANNVFLEDIKNSFDIGVVLGRLASDGSYSVRTDGGSYIQQFVAEHEFNILPELRSCMDALGYSEADNDVRKERNEKIAHLSVYSGSLASEVSELNIKHQVHDNIFMDTEVLRGFLSGWFDGDGGISGSTITLTFGIKYDFEPMIKDLQKALLFLGIRSRYRKYEDRSILAIKTNDNEIFLDTVGFLNQDKQDKGRMLHCIEDEHIFGRCLVVESVEITDEYIDMYDVCNTDGGYYVADGVITHNTAADIYKIAVGRVFKRICREGWLGKVLLDGFIHDELLGEVSNDIDPCVFLKVLREEFEVKITNPDGTPWCPLYMGFGWGMSWYEAKKTELPIELQWELVDKYGEVGHPDYHGDPVEFCAGVGDMLDEFTVRDIRGKCLLPEAQNQTIKPALNKAVIKLCKKDAKNLSKAIRQAALDSYIETGQVNLDEEFLKGYLSKYYIQSVGDGTIDYKVTNDTQACLDMFCALHDTDRSKVNLLSVSNEVKSGGANAGAEYSSNFDDEEDNSEEALQQAIDARISMLGMYLDTDNMKVILRMMPNNYMNFIQARVNRDKQGYQVMFKDCSSGQLYECQAWLTSNEISVIQQMYIKYLNSVQVV